MHRSKLIAVYLACGLATLVAFSQTRDPRSGYSAAGGGAGSPPVDGPTVGQFAQRVFNVATYGAIADDGLEDSDETNLAVADAIAAGGGVVWLPPGDYILQGVDLHPAVSFKGGGSATSYEDNGQIAGITRIKAPASPAAFTPMFRFPSSANASLQAAELTWYGGFFSDITISGALFGEAGNVPTAPSANALCGIDFQSTQKVPCTFDDTTDLVTTTGNHNLLAGDAILVDFLPSATAPTFNPAYTLRANSNFNGTTLFVESVTNATQFKIKTTSGGAAADIASDGTGTFYVGKAITGITDFAIERCRFQHFDCAVRGSNQYDLFPIDDCYFFANWIGVCGSEHPELSRTIFQSNHCGLTGRLLDGYYIGNGFGGNNYGVTPFGTAGMWGTWTSKSAPGTWGTESTTNNVLTYVQFSNFTDSRFYKNVIAGLSVGAGTVVQGNEIVGDGTAHDYSIGVIVTGNYVSIQDNRFGQGTTVTNFGKCAIALDSNGTGAENVAINISQNYFMLTTCPAILATNVSQNVYDASFAGTGAIRTLPKEAGSIIGNTLICTAAPCRLFDVRVTQAGINTYTINHNTILSSANDGGIDAAGGYIEGSFWKDNIIRDNIVISGKSTQSILKTSTAATTALTGMFENNRVTTVGAVPLDFSATAIITRTAIIRQNTGRNAADLATQSVHNNPIEMCLAADFTTASTTLVDVTGMAFTTGANEAYRVELNFACSNSNATDDCFIELTSTGTPWTTASGHTTGSHYSAAGAITNRVPTAFGTTSTALVNPAGTGLVVNDGVTVRPVTMWFYFNVTAASTLKLQLKTSANSTTMYAGARMVIYRVR